MDVRHLYLASLATFGVVSIVDTLLSLGGGPTAVDVVIGAAGLLILGAAVRGFKNPERSGAPEEPGLILYLVVGGTLLYLASTVVTWLGA